MRCGLYGKLPAKRDFIAAFVPREFLGVYEPWLQGGLTASRLKLAGAWQTAFLNAPIWRFWFGAGLFGATAAGAFMPSVDGIGRYFPLTLVAIADPGAAIPPPELDPQDAWYASAEDLLLHALDPNVVFDDLSAALQALAPPSDQLASAFPEDMARLADGTIVSALDPSAFPDRLAHLRIEDHRRSYERTTFFWTLGGGSVEPALLIGHGLPDPNVFTGLLTGQFGTFFR